MKIYVVNQDIVSVAEKDVLKIPNAEIFDVEEIPDNYKIYDFIDGKFVLNKEKEQKLKELEAKAKIDAKYRACAKYIYTHYPQTKQNSDLADKLYYENLLKAQGVQNLEADIAARVQSFYDGKSLEGVLADVAVEHKEAYEQLVKVGIRVAWVQQCKAELKAAIAESREPNFPNYPL